MLVGVALGTALQGLGAVRRVLDPLFATWYAIPIYAFYPLLIVILGLGELPQIAIGFLLAVMAVILNTRSEEHTSELQSPDHLVCRLLLEKKKNNLQSRAERGRCNL